MNRTLPLRRAWSLLLLLAWPLAAERDPRAVELAQRTMEAMGGLQALAAVRLVRFDFQVAKGGETVALYHHWWDRRSDDYRLEGLSGGQPFRVLFNLRSREGEAWLGSERLAGEAASELLATAYGRFVNDSYWLLMPWKWLDPGVHLAHEGERVIDGREYEVVALWFEPDIGLTPGDRYWAFIARDTGLMERWSYLLQQKDGSPGSGAPTDWHWEGWIQTEAGVRISTVKRRLGGSDEITISFPVAELSSPSEASIREALHPGPPGSGPGGASVSEQPPVPATPLLGAVTRSVRAGTR